MTTRGYVARNIKLLFLCGLYSDKPWVFDQSVCPPDPSYILKSYKCYYIKSVRFLTSDWAFSAFKDSRSVGGKLYLGLARFVSTNDSATSFK